jgi:hypothetical protein
MIRAVTIAVRDEDQVDLIGALLKRIADLAAED